MKKIYFLFLVIICLPHLAGAQTTFTVTPDISYKSGNDYTDERCRLDVRAPDKKGSFPVIIWFHGGGLNSGNKYFPGELLGEELVIVTVNYRLTPRVSVKDCIDDAAAAVAWVFKNIDQYNGDKEEIIVSGHSAGGYLTLMVGLDKFWLNHYGIDADLIQALFPFSGHTITHFTARQEMNIPGTRPVIDKMAPLYYVRAGAPSLFLMTGDRELEILGRYEENAYMWRMMKVSGHEKCFLYEFDGHDHGAMVSPGCHVLLEYIKQLK